MQDYDFVEDFINPLTSLISECGHVNIEAQTSQNEETLKKQAVLQKYIQDINENLEELRIKLEQVQTTINEGSYEETYESMKKDADESKKFMEAFGPLFSMYTILS